MAFFGLRLPDDLAARFDAKAIAAGGRSALLRKLIDGALEDAGEASSETALPRTRPTDRLQLRLMRADIVKPQAAAAAPGPKRADWLVELFGRRLHASSAHAPRDPGR